MCCALEFLAKYLLFFFNLVFSIAGIAFVAIGVIVLVHTGEILELIPIQVNLIPISLIVLGCIIFIIAFFGCCGAIRESRCLLVMYAICMIILAGLKIWLAVVIFNNLNNLNTTVAGWLTDAFNNSSLAGVFTLLEVGFRCCGTTGPGSYLAVLRPVPPSCCANPINNTCISDYYDGCNIKLGDYFEAFGDAIAAILIVIIVIELVAALMALFLNQKFGSKKR